MQQFLRTVDDLYQFLCCGFITHIYDIYIKKSDMKEYKKTGTNLHILWPPAFTYSVVHHFLCRLTNVRRPLIFSIYGQLIIDNRHLFQVYKQALIQEYLALATTIYNFY